MNKVKKYPHIYPDIADSVMRSVSIAVVPPSIREQYTRPDTLRVYVPPDLERNTDTEKKRERQRRKMKGKYNHKYIERVVDKIKNGTGQITYKIIWEGSHGETQLIPSKALADHPDLALVEAFEYQKFKIRNIGINGVDLLDV